MTIVSGPMDSERANTSWSSAACRCISISPESSYARNRSAWVSMRDTPRHPPPSKGFMYIG